MIDITETYLLAYTISFSLSLLLVSYIFDAHKVKDQTQKITFQLNLTSIEKKEKQKEKKEEYTPITYSYVYTR